MKKKNEKIHEWKKRWLLVFFFLLAVKIAIVDLENEWRRIERPKEGP